MKPRAKKARWSGTRAQEAEEGKWVTLDEEAKARYNELAAGELTRV